MLFLGTFMGCDEFSIPCTPTDNSTIKEVQITNGKYEKLYITKNVDDALDKTFSNDYGFDTILYAQYDKGSTIAGNVDWAMDNISHLLVKRKTKDSSIWTTIAVAEISKGQVEIMGTDYTNAAKTTYEYALVPSYNGIEGGYDITEITSDFDKIYIISKDGVVYTDITNAFLDTVTNTPSSSIITLNNKYPSIIRNTTANYSTGSFVGSFFKFDEETCQLDLSDKAVTDMQNKVIAFLSDGTPKLIKHFDGRTFLVYIDPEISNNANGYYTIRELSFSFTEIGDTNSSEDLYAAGLTNVTEEWW